MNIQLHAIAEDGKMLETRIFDFTDDVFIRLAKSEFSVLGVSRKTAVTLDGEAVELKLVSLSKFVREALLSYLNHFLLDLVDASLQKMGNSPSKAEYQEHTKDLKELVAFIQALEIKKYNYLNRVG